MREWDSLGTIINDHPSLIHWGYTYNVDYKGNLWVADSEKHVIYLMSKENESINAKFKIAGSEGIPGKRNGNLEKVSFNGPMSLVVYDKNLTKIAEADSLAPIYIAGSNINKTACKYINQYNFSSCGVKVSSDFPRSVIDHKRIKYISFVSYTDKLKEDTAKIYSNCKNSTDTNCTHKEVRIAYIADTNNHCIRQLIVETSFVSTVAGICGSPGLIDGPLTVNKLRFP